MRSRVIGDDCSWTGTGATELRSQMETFLQDHCRTQLRQRDCPSVWQYLIRCKVNEGTSGLAAEVRTIRAHALCDAC